MGALKGNGFNLNILDEMIQRECQILLNAIKPYVGTAFNLATLVRNTTANTGLLFTTGKRFDWNDEHFLKLLNTINTYNTKRMQNVARLFLPNPMKRLFPVDDKQMLLDMDFINSSINRLITEHKASTDIRDLIDVYQHQTSLSSDTASDEDYLKDGVGFLVKAGVHTTAIIFTRVILCLATLPEIQSRVHEEIIRVVGTDRLPRWSDRHRLHYTQATIMEIMRGTRNFASTFHTAGDDTTLRGYTIPKGAILMDLSISVCDDPITWPNPEECRPERFLDENGCYQERMEFFPFGIGK